MNKMMDLKEIIKWFIPCFHILLYKRVKMVRLIYIFLLIIFFVRPICGANLNSFSDGYTKNVDKYNNYLVSNNQSEYVVVNNNIQRNEERSLNSDSSVGRTFGRPMKKLMQALIPLVFQLGAASTWMVVAALVGVKTLAVALIILKILLVAGAAKIGALFGQKSHGWEQPHGHQKEIHLHIHGAGHPVSHEEHISPWNRDGVTADTKNVNVVLSPYAAAGPQTISTPYGNYVRVDSP